jgi:uncharacterized protein YjiS (DUF1127 family)
LSSVRADGEPCHGLRLRKLEGSPVATIKGVITRISTWRARVRLRRQLALLSDRELRDIGICRSEIAHEASKPFWRQ